MTAAKTFRNLLAGSRALIAPAVFNPLSAKPSKNERTRGPRRWD